ncbi:MAG: insulinase family protein [Candidatus Omnitrophica bacterium]|nr:insulinase family protein [Candidatus Omnitrophota bacterium]MCM8823158.1 insulinase family protein [Candidatus Omnitrophota bacterium]MCM8826325.1 insulinase family protein [Candidatus Omnitrophota bacterium]
MFRLLNIGNVKFIFSPMRGFQTSSLGMFINIGARYEDVQLKGISHFLEHMLFKGSKNYTYKEIKREIEGRGGMLNGFTSQETTGYYAQFINKNWKITLDILLDMVSNPLVIDSEIEKERNVILEEVKMHNDLPHIRVNTILESLLWEKHPLGEEIIGEPETIRRIKRENLINFKETYYIPSNMVIACVGDLEEGDLIESIKKKINVNLAGRINLNSYPPSHLNKVSLGVEKKDIDQTHLCLGFRSPSYRSKERLTVELINVILGANMSSRLFEEIREKRGLCYDISTEVRKYKDSGGFIIHLGLDSKNIIMALKGITKTLIKLSNELVSAKELERAKDYFLGQVIMGIEKPQSRMFYMADSYLALNKIYTIEEISNLIEAIDSQRIKCLAKKVFDLSKFCLSCITNSDKDIKNDIDKILKMYN